MADKLSFGLKLRQLAVEDDPNHIISIDTTDTGVLARWSKAEQRFTELLEELDHLDSVEGENEIDKAKALSKKFDEIENNVCETVDALFNTKVSEHIKAYYGSLIRTVDGELLLFKVLDVLMGMYKEDIAKELEKSKEKIKKHTGKYKK